MKYFLPAIIALSLPSIGSAEVAKLSDRLKATHGKILDNRREVLSSLSDPFGIPAAAKVVLEDSSEKLRRKHGWKRNVIATVFWIGEQLEDNNTTPRDKSAWDINWQENFGGYDDPNRRDGYFPEGFIPKLNSFYVALPYNDIGKDFHHRPEASIVIPWFWEAYQSEGISVCKGRWIAIHREGRICYAQWEDVGPLETDHHEYVFGNANARTNQNQGVGLNISPSVRDYLRMGSGERVEWKFVEEYEVPDGPWKISDFKTGIIPEGPPLPER